MQAGDSTALLTDEYNMVSVLTCEFCDLPVLTVASKNNTVSFIKLHHYLWEYRVPCQVVWTLNMSANFWQDLVLAVNDVLAIFDGLVAKHNVYKVDTTVEGPRKQ